MNNIVAWLLPYVVGVLVLFVLSRLAQKTADSGRKAQELADGGLEFAPDAAALVAMRLETGIFGLLGVGGVIGYLFNAHGLWVSLFCVVFALLLAKLLPGTIVLTEAGLEQRYWLGKPKQMRWKDVQIVTVQHKQRSVTVRGRGGVKIQHAKQLPDMERFVAELTTRCPDAMPREGEKRRVVIPPPPPVVAPPAE